SRPQAQERPARYAYRSLPPQDEPRRAAAAVERAEGRDEPRRTAAGRARGDHAVSHGRETLPRDEARHHRTLAGFGAKRHALSAPRRTRPRVRNARELVARCVDTAANRVGRSRSTGRVLSFRTDLAPAERLH